MKTIAAPRVQAFFYPRPRDAGPAPNRGLVAFDGAARGHLRTPAQLMQQPPHMIDVIAHAKASFHEIHHARTGPQIGIKASGLRALEQERLQPTLVSGGQLGWAPGRRLGPHPRLATSSRCRLPAPHAAPINADTPRHLRGQQSFFEQRQRAQAPVLQLLWASGRSHRTPPTGMIGH